MTTHPLHDYIATRIAEKVRERHVVVIYDQPNELRGFFAEAANGADTKGRLSPIALGDSSAQMFEIDGSFLAARAAVEPLTNGDKPDDVIVYVPGLPEGDKKNSLLMELEKAGTVYRTPRLNQLARLVLRKRHDDVAIDGMLKSESLSYEDLTALCRGQDGGDASLLRAVFDSSDPLRILSAWLLDDASDAELERKGAFGELRGLVQGKLGLALAMDLDGARLRATTARYVLANEFRSDLLAGAEIAPEAARLLEQVTVPVGKEALKAVRDLSSLLRERNAEAYVSLANAVEQELRLGVEAVPGQALGAIDTFGFEEVAAARAAIQMVADGRIDEAQRLIDGRGDSFWVGLDPEREAIWQVCRLMLEVCDQAERARREVDRAPAGGARGWVERYTAEDGWRQLDLAQRRFETLLSSIEGDIDPLAVAAVRARYEEAVRRMTEGFVKALDRADWVVDGVLHQTRIWPEVVASRSRPVAYIFVDAMRYEMGVELAERLAAGFEVQLRPAVGALPSITPIGMAALLPGAASSFSVAQQGARNGAMIDAAFLPDRASRQKFLIGKVPDALCLDLDEVLSLGPKALKARVGAASLVCIHSTDIDGAGENAITTASARRIMDNVIGDLARCLKNLAAAGIEDAVITSDHGHLFFAGDRPASMRMEAPGGETVDLHRRCWFGRGGTTPAGAVRVSGARLGYDTDLEFVFPISTAVFKAGGDLAFHHGGPSLQEMIVPVLAVKAKRRKVEAVKTSPVTVTYDFDAITNRIFTIKVELTGRAKGLFDEGLLVRPVVLAKGHEVALAALAVGGELSNGRLMLQPQTQVTVGFQLTNDEVDSVEIQIVDATTDAILYASDGTIPVKLGV
jgi:hypothetical protein